ncbi:hypothetical protein [Hymenobacter glacieicola]|uniref:Fibronectin type-III domain-containing protein n=1 Tax=Hymenobacter glacieicola TaxID=1562124 RepID=A0ABQ1X8I6_9BACT|nr:hypothetical protein [Hymenobacter glacieicola]GGG60625.1 hypothetical protein GCM10011378_40800 [Hymenobacter glacieicola]
MADLLPGFRYIIWNGPSTALASAPWKGNLLAVYKVSANGQGHISFVPPGSQFSAVQTLEPDQLYELRVKTAFTLAEAMLQAAPAGAGGETPAAPTPDTILLAGPAGETVTEFEEVFRISEAATTAVTFTSGAGTVELSLDEGQSWGPLPASLPANSAFALRVQYPNSAAFAASLTLTY